jgi:putative FmdB family regulatory protein
MTRQRRSLRPSMRCAVHRGHRRDGADSTAGKFTDRADVWDDWHSSGLSAKPARTERTAVPTYQYACTEAECGHVFEQFQSFSDDSLTVCPQCQGRLRKVFNAVGVVFKGSGFYRTDSRSNGKPDSSSGSTGAGSTGGSGDSSGSTPTTTSSSSASSTASSGTSSSTSAPAGAGAA